MKKGWRITLITLGVLIAVILIGPFLVPIPPLEGTRPPKELADPDSLFVDIGDIAFHYKVEGEGGPPWCSCMGLAPACTPGRR